MLDATPSRPVWASAWTAVLGLALAALGLAKLLWSDGPDVYLVLLGLFLTTLSGHARTPKPRVWRQRLLEVAMAALLLAMLAVSFS